MWPRAATEKGAALACADRGRGELVDVGRGRSARVQSDRTANCRLRPVARTASISAAAAPSGFDANA